MISSISDLPPRADRGRRGDFHRPRSATGDRRYGCHGNRYDGRLWTKMYIKCDLERLPINIFLPYLLSRFPYLQARLLYPLHNMVKRSLSSSPTPPPATKRSSSITPPPVPSNPIPTSNPSRRRPNRPRNPRRTPTPLLRTKPRSSLLLSRR